MRIINLLFITLLLIPLPALSAGEEGIQGAKSVLEESYGKLPLRFIENRGQADEKAAYYVQGSDKTLYFTSTGVTFALVSHGGKTVSETPLSVAEKGPGAPVPECRRWIVKLEFAGAHCLGPRGEGGKKTVFSYFRGKPEDWRTGVPSFGRIVYEELWPGIDLVFHGTADRLKYEFRVKPGADANAIRLAYHGAESVTIADSGVLEVRTPLGSFEDEKPFAYQEVEGERVAVSMDYTLLEEPPRTGFTLGFKVGEYDRSRLLVLDPSLLVYCGYIGGSNEEHGYDIAVDGSGRAYVTGFTRSDEIFGNFPVKTGPDLSYNGGGQGDAFVARVNAAGTDLEYCGYIGGGDSDRGTDIAVDGSGRAYITGYTYSNETTDGFPVKVGPYLVHKGSRDAFVARVNAAGTDLEYCGYIGGTQSDEGDGIAVDGSGRAYVTGDTTSEETVNGFPVKVGPFLSHSGGIEGFVARVNAAGTDLEYCGYIGGSQQDQGTCIAADASGSAYVGGYTESSENTNFPVKVGPDLTYNFKDVFVAKVNAAGTALDYCGYIGGSDLETSFDIAVDGNGRAYVTGYTHSDETGEGFPVVVGPDLTFNASSNDSDAFVARVSASGAALEYCGYIGGAEFERGLGIAVDSLGRACVSGYTYSDEAAGGFPVKLGPDLTLNGYQDAFVTRVNAAGTDLDFCGYIGGDFYDEGFSVAVDASDMIYVTGHTVSSESTFPVLIGPDLTFNSAYDAFVAKVNVALSADTYTLSESAGGTVTFKLGAGPANAGRNYLMLGGVSGDSPGTPLPGGQAVLALNWDIFTNYVFTNINSLFFQNFLSTLDGSGSATAVLNFPGPLPPGTAGLSMYFAFALNQPWNFASNAAAIQVVP